MNRNLPNILFVGAFNMQTKDGSSGGQLFACTSLVNSNLKDQFNFITIDSTAETVPAPPIYKRVPKVISRLARFIFLLLFKKIRCVLIFSSAKFSFLEKGLMVIMANILFKKVIFAPRSGLILTDYENSKFMKVFIPLVVKSATYVLCQGQSWKEFYKGISNAKEEKFIVVHNWIDITPYLQKKTGHQNPTLKIIYVGWFEEYKGIIDLLKALKTVAKNGIKFHCDIYGNGSLYGHAEEFIAKNHLKEWVTLKGWADKKVKMEAFKTADMYILPSHYEGFPNALLEAMASQLPVIATRITSIDDIIEHGHNGMLAECKNPDSLALQIQTLLTDEALRFKIATNARETVIKKFTIQTAVQKFEKIF